MTVTLIKPFYIHLFFTILWFLFMTWLSHQDGEHTSRTSLELANHMKHWFPVRDIGKLNQQLRRAAHVILFAVFTILLTRNPALGPCINSRHGSGADPGSLLGMGG